MDGNEGNTVLEVFCNDITVFNLNVYKTEYCIGLYGSEHHGRKQQGERELSQKGLSVYQVLGFTLSESVTIKQAKTKHTVSCFFKMYSFHY